MANENMIWTKTEIRNLLDRSNVAVEHALVALYARQTADEQETENTSHKNGQGFGAFDAEIFSSFAKLILSSNKPEGYRLTPGRLAICRKQGKSGISRLGRYAGQLLDVTEAKGHTVDRRAA